MQWSQQTFSSKNVTVRHCN